MRRWILTVALAAAAGLAYSYEGRPEWFITDKGELASIQGQAQVIGECGSGVVEFMVLIPRDETFPRTAGARVDAIPVGVSIDGSVPSSSDPLSNFLSDLVRDPETEHLIYWFSASPWRNVAYVLRIYSKESEGRVFMETILGMDSQRVFAATAELGKFQTAAFRIDSSIGPVDASIDLTDQVVSTFVGECFYD